MLQQGYGDPAAVDDELVDIIVTDMLQSAALPLPIQASNKCCSSATATPRQSTTSWWTLS